MSSNSSPEQRDPPRTGRLLLFLRWFRPALLGFGALFAAIGALGGPAGLGWSGAVILGYGLALFAAEALCAQGRERAAVDLTAGGMLLATVLIVPLAPPLFPTLAMVPFIACAVALPYRSGAAQGRLMAICCVISVGNLAAGEVLSAIAGPNTPLMTGLAISSFAAAGFYVTFLLWQIGRRLSEGLAASLAANAALREARAIELRMLERQHWESLGVLAGGVAHDFNNLLTAILGNAALARLSLPARSESALALEEIERATERAAELTRQLLVYAGGGRILMRPLDLNVVAREVVELLRAAPGAWVPELELAATPLRVHGDEAQLRQAMLSLLINAREATVDGGAVQIRTAELVGPPAPLELAHRFFGAAPGPLVCLEVCDSGVGMDAATLGRACEPFFSTKFTGRGLGLAAVLGIVRGHAGALEAESAPGAGSRFRLLLPAVGGEG